MAQELEYLKLRHEPENVNLKHRSSLGFQDKIALFLTRLVGTMYAVYFFILFMGGWMFWQTAVASEPFDPFPFTFLLFLGNIIQLLLIPLIMVGQNLLGRHAKIRADEEYKTTQSSYKDIEEVLIRLNKQDEEIKKQMDILLALQNKNKTK